MTASGPTGFDGYSPGVFTIGRLIAYLENRDGNCNVRFKQAETHRRFFEIMSSFGIHTRSFRADCGSYSEDIVKVVMEHTEKFYIRAERYQNMETMKLRAMIGEHILSQFRSRYLDLHCSTPRERYEMLLQRCPGIMEFLDLQDIASFLNVHPNTVSKIRRDITFGDR